MDSHPASVGEGRSDLKPVALARWVPLPHWYQATKQIGTRPLY